MVGLILFFFGYLLMVVVKLSAVAMSLAGGLVLLIYAIKSTLKEPKLGEQKDYATNQAHLPLWSVPE